MNNTRTPMAVRSPCLKVCQTDPATQLCRGCYRTQEERDWWVAYGEDQKRDVLLRCAQREHVLRSGKGDLAPSMGIVESRREGRTS